MRFETQDVGDLERSVNAAFGLKAFACCWESICLLLYVMMCGVSRAAVHGSLDRGWVP